jgi:DNA-binding transcriptional ArsR family regulator
MNNSSIYDLQAEFCKAMSHPARIEILHTLRDCPKHVNEIAEILGINQAGVSRHLGVLRHNGLVDAVRQGQDVLYSITNPQIPEICDLMRKVLLQQFANRSELIQSMHDEP